MSKLYVFETQLSRISIKCEIPVEGQGQESYLSQEVKDSGFSI